MKSLTISIDKTIISLGYISVGILYICLVSPTIFGDYIATIRVISGIYFLLFFPGYFLVDIFFLEGELDYIEKFGLSVVFSLISVPLLIFYANLAGVTITPVNVFSIVLCAVIAMNLSVIIPKRPRLGVGIKGTPQK